jgi:selenide,water dikinase
VRDSEIKYGLSVTGRVDPDRIITNAGARPGDRLVLSKPIGSGVLTSAAKTGRMEQKGLAEAVRVMSHLNHGGAEAMREVGVRAATDVTGFGLVGHAAEVAEASQVTLEIEAAAVPLLERTLEFAGQGMVTRMHKSTLTHLGSRLDARNVDPTLLAILCDAQTSGGLLTCVSAERCDALVASLRRHKTPCAAVIGQVTARQGAAIRLV